MQECPASLDSCRMTNPPEKGSSLDRIRQSSATRFPESRRQRRSPQSLQEFVSGQRVVLPEVSPSQPTPDSFVSTALSIPPRPFGGQTNRELSTSLRTR